MQETRIIQWGIISSNFTWVKVWTVKDIVYCFFDSFFFKILKLLLENVCESGFSSKESLTNVKVAMSMFQQWGKILHQSTDVLSQYGHLISLMTYSVACSNESHGIRTILAPLFLLQTTLFPLLTPLCSHVWHQMIAHEVFMVWQKVHITNNIYQCLQFYLPSKSSTAQYHVILKIRVILAFGNFCQKVAHVKSEMVDGIIFFFLFSDNTASRM